MREQEADQFDCDTCPLAASVQALDGSNAEAWSLYRRVYSRLNVEWGLVPDLFRRLVAGMDDDDVLELVDRLSLIFGILNPPPQPGPD